MVSAAQKQVSFLTDEFTLLLIVSWWPISDLSQLHSAECDQTKNEDWAAYGRCCKRAQVRDYRRRKWPSFRVSLEMFNHSGQFYATLLRFSCLYIKQATVNNLRANKPNPFVFWLSKGAQKMIRTVTFRGREKFDYWFCFKRSWYIVIASSIRFHFNIIYGFTYLQFRLDVLHRLDERPLLILP